MDDERTDPTGPYRSEATPPPTEPIGGPADDGPRWVPEPNESTAERIAIGPIETPRRRTGLVVGIVGLVALLVAGAAVLMTRGGGGEAVALSYSLEEGTTTTQTMTMTMDGTMGMMGQTIPLDMTITATVTQEVISVDADGVATVEVRVEGMEMDSPLLGDVGGVPDAEPVRMKVHPDGRIETEGGTLLGNAGMGGFAPGGNQLSAILPDEPVAPGDTWTEEVDLSGYLGSDGALTYETHNEFLRYEDVDGREAAVIRSSADIPMDLKVDFAAMGGLLGGGVTLPPGFGDISMSMSGEGSNTTTSWFDAAAGEQIRIEMEADMDATIAFEGAPSEMQALFGDGMDIDVTMTMTMEPAP